ncbi:uncharacterized protein N7511_002679 [Penicillium nucicola]|uniref:uncharacterized protein n=1 Tax=Penicillium nucicola TaxID=1850975 RepID=UPI0025454A94|nr:uncharacterized protein N7511_002679 [Penicillium nucicola]KAJ5770628.1 hypothetical protein N7511_002679 [Penicillium nucicola]
MANPARRDRRVPEATEAWIIGSGTSSLASAVYLIQLAHLRPSAVHVLDEHLSMQQAMHQERSAHDGYDQFAGCLPIPAGKELNRILDMVPSAVEGQSHLHYIQEEEKNLALHSSQGTSFVAQTEHGAIEFRRAVKQYLSGFHSLSILTCLDFTGRYQYEAIYVPIYFFLQSQGVDFQFGVKVRNVETTVNQHRHIITRLAVSQHGLDFKYFLGPSDIVIGTPGSTVSGSSIGNNNTPPAWDSIEARDQLDANWALWLEAGNRYPDHGNPYTFCTRKSESMLESFTITTEHVEFFDYLQSLLQSKSHAGTIILMNKSSWGVRLCLPLQPVFAHQSQDVRVLWGFALFPEKEGDCFDKSLLSCSGFEILCEILHHLDIPDELASEVLQRSITIPRAMPRMSSTLLTRSLKDRPGITPESVVNLGLVGPFVETPWRTCVDTSYGVYVAREAVSRLMGLQVRPEERSGPSILRVLMTLLWR